MPNSKTCRLRIRQGLTGVSVVILVVAIAFTVVSLLTTTLESGLEDIKFNELTNESIKSRVEFSRSLFQITLLITGALWALLIAKKDEAGIVFGDRLEIIMFLCGSALLVASLIDHSVYLQYVSRIYSIAGKAFNQTDPSMPDVFDPNINNFYIYQVVHLVLGFAIAVVTLISAHRLKETP